MRLAWVVVAAVSAGAMPAAAETTSLSASALATTTVRIEPLPTSRIAIAPLEDATQRQADVPRGSMLTVAAVPTPVSRVVIEPIARSTIAIEELEPGAASLVAVLRSELGARETERGTLISLPGDILFDFDRATLRPAAVPTLRKLAELIRASPERLVLVEGHTDAKGSDAYNLGLSERRARSVAQWLTEAGDIPPGRLEEHGWGESRPAAPNTRPDGSDDPEGRQRNRRVEVILTR